MMIPVLEFPNISVRFPFRFSEEFSVCFRSELRGEKYKHGNLERGTPVPFPKGTPEGNFPMNAIQQFFYRLMKV
ncbi:hypothetical protein CDAR_84341 [Caerostris darwini]|uniref:Uncharacterized protein n=1 Tax=Caerostris darwini TaxID=1538125 RepID=A0AAV4X0P4_9ARAC|nr:hypothetical protein CDAR_84341 [Caerostris darwini]